VAAFTPLTIRGRIGLIEAGSGLIVGEAEIDRMQSAPKSYRARHMTRAYHRIPEARYNVMDKWCWAWVLFNVLRYDEPVAYAHPQGAVIWVSLPNVEAWHPLQRAPLPFRLRFVATLRLRLGAGSGLSSAALCVPSMGTL